MYVSTTAYDVVRAHAAVYGMSQISRRDFEKKKWPQLDAG